MRDGSFWHQAAKSLPAAVRQRYAGDFEAAERMDDLLELVVRAGSRVKNAIARWLHGTPRTTPDALNRRAETWTSTKNA